MVTAPLALTTRRHRPTVHDVVRARLWSCLTLLAVGLSFAVGDGVASTLGVEDGAPATPGQGAVVVLAVAALLAPPVAMTWHHARRIERDGGRGARVTAVVATTAAGGFLLMNVVAWLVGAAGWAVNRL